MTERIKTTREFMTVPEGTHGKIERDFPGWKLTLDFPKEHKEFVIWIDDQERRMFLTGA